MEFFLAFLIGGFISVIGQLLYDSLKLSPTHLMSIFVVIGVILSAFGLYEPFIELAGTGATFPLTNLGHLFLQGAMKQAEYVGLLGIGMGVFDQTSTAISATILFSFIIALFFKPKG